MAIRGWHFSVFSIALAFNSAAGDDLIYRYEGDVLPYPDAGWWAGNCTGTCHELLEDGYFVLRWDYGTARRVNFGYYISRPDTPPPPTPPFWVEWRFSSNHTLRNNPTCDAYFSIQYLEFFDLIDIFGDAVVSFDGGVVQRGFPINEFRSYRFETWDGLFGCFFIDGRLFTCYTATGAGNEYSIIQMKGRGGCDLSQPATINKWDFVRYGTISYGEQIVSSDPPAGFVDARAHPMLDRFNVTYDSPNYVFIDEISVDVAATEPLSHEATQGEFAIRYSTFTIPSVIATRRLDNGPPETIEIVLDRPIPYNATTRFTFNDGVAVNTVEFTFAPGDTDGDGDADLSDFAAFQNCFGHSPVAGVCHPLDFNADGAIDLLDFAEWQKLFVVP